MADTRRLPDSVASPWSVPLGLSERFEGFALSYPANENEDDNRGLSRSSQIRTAADWHKNYGIRCADDGPNAYTQ